MATPDPASSGRPAEPARGGSRGYGSYGYGGYGAGQGQGYGYGGYGSGQRGTPANPIMGYLLMLRERYWWVILSVLVFLTLALLNTFNTTAEYRATGRLRVFRLAPNINGGSSAADDNFKIVSNDDFFTAVEAMRSANIIEGVSRRLTTAERKLVLEPYQAGNIFSGPLTEQDGQFQLGDHRSLDEVVRDCAELGYLPSFCTACTSLPTWRRSCSSAGVTCRASKWPSVSTAICTLTPFLRLAPS